MILDRIPLHHRNTAIYLGVSALARGLALALVPLYTARLTRGEYATYGLCQTLLWVLGPLLSLGLGAALARFYFDSAQAARRDRNAGTIGALLIVLALAASSLVELGLELAPSVHLGAVAVHQLRLVLWIAVATAIADLPLVYCRAAERAGRFALASLWMSLVTVAATLVLLLGFDAGLDGIFLGLLLGQLAGVPLALWLIFARLGVTWDPVLLRAAVRYGLPFVFHYAANALLLGVDRWVLERQGLREGLGLYTVAMQFALPITMVGVAWYEATAPRLQHAWRDGGATQASSELRRMVAGLLALTSLALAALLLALPLLRWFVDPRFQGAFAYLPWLGLIQIVGVLQAPFLTVFMLRKESHVVPLITVASVAISVGVSLLLVPRLGVVGAILGSGSAYFFRSLVTAVGAMVRLRAAPPSPGALSAA